MKAFLVVAHGSRREQSNEEIRQVAERFRQQNQADYPIVLPGFLELAEPNIEKTITQAIAAGATHLDILPYFLAAGTHVVNDIPTEVKASLADHPDISYTILPHIGGARGMVGLIHSLTQSGETR